MAKVPGTIFGRAGRLLAAGAKIAATEISGRAYDAVRERPAAAALAQKVRQTRELVATLGQLKGAAMKAGQMLALELGDLLPPEVVEVLRELHDSCGSMPFDQVRYILRRELGVAKLAKLEDLTPEPIAAASIGQVHKATLDGKPVVVKVQFPGVAKSIDADLAVLRRIVNLYLSTQGKTIDTQATFEELAKGFKEEADYRLEAANLALYKETHGNPDFVVPDVFGDYSTERVLTLSFEAGRRLGEWLKAGPTRAAVDRFAPLVVRLMVEEFFVHGVVQTDPNYGNFLYREQEGRIVLLDFGATKRYPASFRKDIRDLMKAVSEGDDAAVMALTFDHELLDRREPPEVIALYLAMLRKITAMFAPERQPFNFGDDRFLRELRELVIRFTSAVRHSPPARQLIFLNRKLGGMFHLLKDLDATLDLRPFFEDVLALRLDG
jgi:aarF domain-containing kinase